MRKVIVVVCILLLTSLLSACTLGGVSENQIRADLQSYFGDGQYIVNNVTVDVSRNDGDSATYEVTAMISAEEAELVRRYRMLYSHYNSGDWILDNCNEIDTESWVAVPKTYEIPKERIAEVVFEPQINGGYNLNVENAKFWNWSKGASKSYSAEEDIRNVEYFDSDKDTMRTLVYCGVQSAIIKLNETIEILWKFDKFDLEWDAVSKTSIESDCEFRIDFSGEYIWDFNPNGNRRKIIEQTDTGLSIKDEGVIECSGLFEMCVKNSNGKERLIDLRNDPIRIRYWEYGSYETYIKK